MLMLKLLAKCLTWNDIDGLGMTDLLNCFWVTISYVNYAIGRPILVMQNLML